MCQGWIQTGCTGCTCTRLVSEYIFIVCSRLETPECLGKLRMYSQYYETEYRVHPVKLQKKGAP